MGLDVYLRYSSDWDTAIHNESDYNEAMDKLYEEMHMKYNIPEDKTIWDNEEAREEFKVQQTEIEAQYGISGYTPQSIHNIEIDDTEYPEHYFKIGYFRSSYNPSGINHILKDRIGVDLYDIFASLNDVGSGYNTVDWNNALEEARSAHSLFSEYLDREISRYFAIECGTRNMFAGDTPITDKGGQHFVEGKEGALQYFEEEMNKHTHVNFPGEETNDYSNLAGDWFPDGLPVYALIKGQGGTFTGPCIYAIAKRKDEDEGLAWYLHALEIVIRTCEYVLAKDDPDNYRLVWSG
jgi:hypothetical protein